MMAFTLLKEVSDRFRDLVPSRRAAAVALSLAAGAIVFVAMAGVTVANNVAGVTRPEDRANYALAGSGAVAVGAAAFGAAVTIFSQNQNALQDVEREPVV